MIIAWRGRGLWALLVLFPLAGSSPFLLDLEPAWIFWLAGFLSVLFAGAVCVYCGTRWNRFGLEHSFYFVPLQAWGLDVGDAWDGQDI